MEMWKTASGLHTVPQRLLLRISILTFLTENKNKQKKEAGTHPTDNPKDALPLLRYGKCAKISLYPCTMAETGS